MSKINSTSLVNHLKLIVDAEVVESIMSTFPVFKGDDLYSECIMDTVHLTETESQSLLCEMLDIEMESDTMKSIKQVELVFFIHG